MQRTILLLDGSDAMNSSADYLPSYLLAMRPPLLHFLADYLDSTPLASVGIVVMRDGISHRLTPCTTNANELVDALEREYFLFGGSGSMSLENGLRLALSELVDLRRPTARTATTHRRVVLLSASVTLVDPTDVYKVLRAMVSFGVEVSAVSLVGAVHVFHEAARITGGGLHCPLHYDHLRQLMHELAVGHTRPQRVGSANEPTRKRPRPEEQVGATMLPIGFPVHLTRTASNETGAATTTTRHLACPQCHLLQTTIPSTCPLCRLLLCSVPVMYASFAAHNQLLPSARREPAALAAHPPQTSSRGDRCALCVASIAEGDPAWQCEQCMTWRCQSCHVFCGERLGLCPMCISTA